MIVAGSANPLLLASAGGYNLTNSLRFRSSASAGLARTYSATRTSGTIITFSTWLKRGSLAATNQTLFFGYDGSSAATSALAFSQDGYNDQITFQFGGSSGTLLATLPVYRDPSAWYHIVLAIDTTQATNTNRVKIYVNNVQVTSFSNTFYPSQNATHQFLLSNANNGIGYRKTDNAAYFDGYMAETHCIDGQALTPSSFGQTSATTGVWQPKKFVGTYGTNGFYLPFTDNSALTTSSNVGLGKDFSGNGNYWTTNNISITSGVTYDSMTDVPTLTSATAANYCVLNPLSKGTNTSITNGNLSASYGSAAWTSAFGTLGVSTGKWYWEATLTSAGTDVGVGISTNPAGSANSYIGGDVNSWGYYANNGNKWNNGSSSSYGATYANGDVIGIALDLDAGTLTFYKNNTSQGTAFSSLASNTYFPALSVNNSSFAVNFGQRPFSYTPPTGFVALNTFNLPTPTIGATASTQAGKYFNIALYSGNSTARTISGLGFQPDFNWTKPRNAVGSHVLTDAVRGVTNFLETNSTGAEQTGSTGIQSWNSDGYALGTGNDWNITGETFVSWNWRASGTTVTNTAGSITSTVSANTSSGFSIVTYTGTGANATVGHGLGVAPKMVIIKSRSTSDFWVVWQTALSGTEYLLLNSTNGKSTAATYFNSTTPSSTVFSLGSDSRPNGNGTTYVAYCFSEVAGYSKFGSYVGNSSADGTFIYTGFKPAYVMRKRVDSTSDWVIADDARNPNNEVTYRLYANVSDSEGGEALDFLSNGFKNKADGSLNTSGGTYIYMAFAENPFKYSLAR